MTDLDTEIDDAVMAKIKKQYDEIENPKELRMGEKAYKWFFDLQVSKLRGIDYGTGWPLTAYYIPAGHYLAWCNVAVIPDESYRPYQWEIL